jgi:tetratricopeptide (TPR) repeat protein
MNRAVTLGFLVFAGIVATTSAPLSSVFAAGSGSSSMPSSSAPSYDPTADYQAGVAALKESRFADAKRAFDRVLGVTATDANTNYLAGLARAGLKDDKGAARYFAKAIKYDDTLIPAHKQYGLALVGAGQRDKAQAELDAMKARAATCAGTCPQAADLKDAVDSIAAALAGAPQARLSDPGSLLFAGSRAGDQAYLDAVGLINEHRYEEAIASLHRAEQTFGPHPDILTYLGFANRKLKRYDIAEAYYLKALSVAPHHKGATEYYGELMVERGDLAGARQKLAALDAMCAFGCYEAEELRRWIEQGHGSSS